MGTGTRRTTILLYGTRVLYGLSNHGPGRHRRPSRHRSRAPPVTVAAAAASGGAYAPHVVQVWNSNNPARMRGGGGRGSSVWSKVGLCAVRPHAVFMSFGGRCYYYCYYRSAYVAFRRSDLSMAFSIRRLLTF